MTPADNSGVWIVLGYSAGGIVAVDLRNDGSEAARAMFADADLAAWVTHREIAGDPRWVWSHTPTWYRALLAAGVRVARCHDLRLVHTILRDSATVRADHGLREATQWDAPPTDTVRADEASLFDVLRDAAAPTVDDVEAALAEFARQRAAMADAERPDRMTLLAAAESAGALLAVELTEAGVPWDARVHEALLTSTLGTSSASGAEPERLVELASRVRDLLEDPSLRLDSQQQLLRALHRVGIMAESTSRAELGRHRHPVIEPLIQYRRLWRLWTANGSSWLREWVHQGRFRPTYVPAGVVTGRWSSSGGGALQIPRHLRAAIRADPGWMLVVADVAQLEPRVLAAMSGDLRMAEAARGRDLYAGIVETGAIATRADAKVALLGAMYGATAGQGGQLMPSLRRSYPVGMGLVDNAASAGESGGVVTTLLGRSSPPPSSSWLDVQRAASEAGASAGEQARARRQARDRGRFTRNFVVQGTAAEWALVWLAELRAHLHELPVSTTAPSAAASGPVLRTRPHIALFLHDEIVVHTPAERADEVVDAVRDAAATAGRRLFGGFPVDFALDLRIARSAAKD